MALTHISAKNQVSNIETDTSTEAKTCRIFYEDALKFVLADVDWGFATARKTLALLSETAPDDWDYVYTYPSDCIKARQIFDGSRRTGTVKIPFEVNLNSDRTVKVIMTDQDVAQLRYTANISDPNLFPPGFVMAFSRYLAYLIAMPLTKKQALEDKAKQKYMETKKMAEVMDAHEETYDDMPESEFIQGR